MTFQTGYERLCGVCSKKNSQVRGALSRKSKSLPAWNKGLSETTSESVRRAAQGCRDFIKKHGHWRTGQTKENNESITRAAHNISRALTEKWQVEKHWTQHGQTSETDDRIKRRSERIGEGVRLNHWSRNANSEDIKRSIIETRKRLIENGTNSPFRLSLEEVERRVDALRSRWNIEKFEFAGYSTPVHVTCVSCNVPDIVPFNVLYKGKVCSTCYPANFSRWHREVFDFFVKLDSNAIANDRQSIAPYELDIVSGNGRIAIECNGVYWHSEATGTPPSYHQDKSTRALERGVSLLHIFDDEWHHDVKKNIIKSMIRVKLGLATRVMARKLHLRSGRPAITAQFMANNHLDGNTPSSHSFWLEDIAGNIICALTLRKPHQQTKWGSKTIELARVSTARDTIVVGGMSRLINAARDWSREHGYQKMITYRDMRLGGTGRAYELSGFRFDHMTQPRFWWTDGQNRIDRFAVRAIPGIASQEEMAMEHRLFKIFGCSNAVYVMDL
jgi:hypothetical protein